MNWQTWLETMYATDWTGKEAEGSIGVMRFVDDLLHQERFDDCNALLEAVDVAKFDKRISLAFATITNGVPPEILPTKASLRAKLREQCGPLAMLGGAQC